MAEDSIGETPLDYEVDSKQPPLQIKQEKYEDDVAGQHTAQPESEPEKSQTMAEIESMVSKNILGKGQTNLSRFGIAANQKNDFRLKDLTRKLSAQIQKDFAGDIKTGPISNRVRSFDVRSQSMRMITANAVLGSYQFQKNQSLPFMRKSLSLDYEKVNLLKKMVSGLGNLEKSLLEKLEAIKMNTAKAAPAKEEGFFKKAFNEYKQEKITKIKKNMFELLLKKKDQAYQKRILPLVMRLNKSMQDQSDAGGVNGAINSFSSQLNKLRRSVNRTANPDVSPTTPFGRVTQTAAKAASGILSNVVRAGQTTRISDQSNRFVSKHLRPWTALLERYRPYGTNSKEPEETPTAQPAPTAPPPTSTPPTTGGQDSSVDTITKFLKQWRDETKQYRLQVLHELTALRQSFGGKPKPPGKASSKTMKQRIPSAPTPPPAPTQPTNPVPPPASTRRRFTLPKIRIPSVGLPKVSLPRLRIPFGQTTEPAPASAEDMVQTVTSPLVASLNQINQTLQGQGKLRTAFETFQTKRQRIADRLYAALHRKGSYEDIESQRKAAANGRRGGGNASTGEHGGDPEDPSHGKDPDAIGGWHIPTIAEMLGGAAGFVGAKALAGSKKGAGWLIKKAIPKTLKAVVPRAARAGWSITKLLGRFAGREAAGAGRIAGRAGMGLLRMGGVGLLKLGMSGLGLGIGTSIADHYLQKSSASDSTKRVGGTGLNMLGYGATGAEIGALFGGVGAIPGAIIGAGVGAVIANADYAGKALKYFGGHLTRASSTLWTRLFGKSAAFDSAGRVVRQEQYSLLDEIRFMFGTTKDDKFLSKKAVKDANGNVISPERMNILGDIRYGFQKTLFGDKFSNGEYKEGTSLLSMMGNGIASTIRSFGKEMKALPGQIRDVFTSAYDKASQAAANAKNGIVGGYNYLKNIPSNISQNAKKFTDGLTKPETKPGSKASGILAGLDVAMGGDGSRLGALANIKLPSHDKGNGLNLFDFSVGTSLAIFGWASDNGFMDNPSSPFYQYITTCLGAYGVKDRLQYKLIHSLENNQEKINNGRAKPLNDEDMAWAAGRFGLDPKNQDAVNYYKLWYKRRFLPALSLIGKVLKGYHLTYDSVVGADEKILKQVVQNLQGELRSSDLTTLGLEPSVQSFNKYAKQGSADPGGKSPTTTINPKSFDPRDPKNRANQNGNSGGGGYTSALAAFFGRSSANDNGGGGGSPAQQRAARTKAQMVKGGVKDQPEYKAAYQALPPNLKKLVDKSSSLQFVLWSTSVQHGADTASKIFQKDYSNKLDNNAYIRSIYQDRSTRFNDLGSDDRTEAMGHIGEEMKFALGIQGGANPDMNAMGKEVGNLVVPLNAKPVTGDTATRAKDSIKYLMSKGYNKTAAIAIVANLIQESDLKTNAVGDSGAAHGIAQWHGDRRKKIFDRFKTPVESMDLHGQLDAVDWEIKSGSGVTGGKDLAGDLNRSPDVRTAVSQMVNRYERPADRQGNVIARTKIALGLMNVVGDDQGKAGSTATPPARKSTPPTPQPQTKATPPANTNTPHPLEKHINNHSTQLAANTAALNSHAAAISNSTKSSTTNTTNGGNTTHHHTVVSPVIAAPGKDSTGFLSVSMRKAALAAG